MIKVQILSKASNQVLASFELMEGEMKEFSEAEVIGLFKEEATIEVVEGEGLGLREEGDMVFLFSNGETLRFRKYYPLVEEGRIAQADIQGIEVPAPEIVSVDTDSFDLDEENEAFDLDIEEREGRFSDPAETNVVASSPALALAVAPFFVQEPVTAALAPFLATSEIVSQPPVGELDLSRGRVVDDFFGIQLQAKAAGAAETVIPTARFSIGTSLTSLLAQNGPLFPTGKPVNPSVETNDTYQDRALAFRALEVVRLEQAAVRNPTSNANNTLVGDFTKTATFDSGGVGEFTRDPKGEFTLLGNYGQVWVGRSEGKVVYQINSRTDVRSALFGIGKDGYVQDVFKVGIKLPNFDESGRSVQVKSEFAVRIFGINDAPTAHGDQPLWPASKDLSDAASPPNTPTGSALRVILVVEQASAEMNPVLEPVGPEIHLAGRDLIGATAPANSLFANDIDADLKVGVIRVTQIESKVGNLSQLVVTAPGHGLKAGDLVALDGLVGSSTDGSNLLAGKQLSGLNTQFKVLSVEINNAADPSDDTFTVGVSTPFGGAFVLKDDAAAGGSGMVAVVPSAIGAQNLNPLDTIGGTSTLVVYAPDHRLVVGDRVVLRGITGALGDAVNGKELTVGQVVDGGKFALTVPGQTFTDNTQVGGADVTLQKLGVFGTSGNLTAVSNARPADLEWVVYPLKSASTITGAGDVAADDVNGVQTLERSTPTALTVVQLTTTGNSQNFRVFTATGHGMEIGDRVTLAGLPLSIGGVDLNGKTFSVQGITTSNSLILNEDVPAPIKALSSQTVSALVGASMTETGVLLKGLFGDLVFKVDGSFIYTRNFNNLTTAEANANPKEGFVVQLRDEANLRMQELRIQIPVSVLGSTPASGSTPAVLIRVEGDVDQKGSGTYTLQDLQGNEVPESWTGFTLASGWTGFNITEVDPLNSNSGLTVKADPPGVGDTTSVQGVGDTWIIQGQYGTLTVNRWSGHYTYVLDQKSAVVEALTGQESTAPTEKFQYTVFDGNRNDLNARPLSSTAVLTLTIRGSNDSPALSVTSSLAASNAEEEIVVLTGGALTDGVRGSRDLATILATLGDTHTLVEGDPDDGSIGLTYTLTTVPSATLEGSMVRLVSAGGAVSVVLGLGDTFTHEQVTNGLIGFRPVANFNTQKNGNANVPTLISLSLADGGEDGALALTGVTVNLTLTRVNDEPTLVGTTAGPVTFTEPADPLITNELPASGALPVGPLYSISKLLPGPDTATFAGADPEHDQVIDRIVIRVTGVANGANEKLVWGGTDVALVAGTTVDVTLKDATATDFTFTVAVTSAGGGNLDVTITGALRMVNPGANLAGTGDDILLDQPRIVLNSLHYRNVAENAGGSPRTFTITSIRDDIGSGDRLLDGLTVQTTVTVTPTNDAPVLVSSAFAVLTTISEDAIGVPTTEGDTGITVLNPGNTVASILASNGSLTDVDLLAGVFNPLQGLALTAANVTTGAGTWQFSTDGGTTWQGVGTVSGTEALLLRSTDRLRFLPDQKFAATGQIEFRGWDQTSGAFGAKVNVTANGGQTAFSAATKQGNITITAVNDKPVLDLDNTAAGTGFAVGYEEDANPVLIASANVSVADLDSADFNGGRLTVSITAGGRDQEDELALANSPTPTAAGAIGINAGNVTLGDGMAANVIGTISGGSNGSALVILFTSALVTPGVTESLMEAVTYVNTNKGKPKEGARTVQFVVTDGDGGTSSGVVSTVTVAGKNDAPVLDLNGPGGDTAFAVNYTEGDGARAISDSDASVSDDNDDFNGGSITVTIASGGVNGEDVLGVISSLTPTADGALAVSGGNLTLGTGGGNSVVIGTVSGGAAGSPLVINFTSGQVTPTVAEALLQKISYTNTNNDNPNTVAPRVLQVVLNDGAATDNIGTTVVSTITVTAVNDAPSAGGAVTVTNPLGAAVVIPEDAPAPAAANIRLTPTTLTDVDSLAPNQVRLLAVDGGVLTQEDGTAIVLGAAGTLLTLAAGGLNLRFTPDPDRGTDATFTYVLVDRDNSALNSGSSTATVSILSSNDAPVVDLNGPGAGANTTLNYTEGATAQIIGTGAATVTDADNANFNGGSLVVTISAGGVAAQDVLGFQSSGSPNGNGNLAVSGGNLTLGKGGSATTIGTVSGGTNGDALTITFNNSGEVTPTVARNVLRLVTYFNNSEENPTAGDRTLSIVMNDGDGGASTVTTSTVTVVAVNDAPSAGGAVTVTDTANAAVSIDEDAPAPAAANIRLTPTTLTDVDSPTPTQVRIISVTGGVLTQGADGSAITLGAAGTLLTLTAGALDLRFTPAADRTVAATFQYVVVDSSGLNSVASTATVNITPVNDAPVLNFNGAAPELSAAGNATIVLAPALTVADVELEASGNFNGASMIVRRQTGANASDLFSFASIGGGISVQDTATGGNFRVGGNTFATFDDTTVPGQVTIFFSDAAGAIPTLARVNAVIQALQLDNDSAAEGVTLNIQYVFDDGNTGVAQGTGGNKNDTETLAVNVVAPITLDLDGDGLEFVGAGQVGALQFDMNGDNVLDSVSWVRGGDGVLVYDADQDGKVSHRSEFVFTDWGGGRTDLAALAANFDSTKDGKLDASDEGWGQFSLWHDLNQDGVFGSEELVPLDEYGIRSIGLQATEGSFLDGGFAYVGGTSLFERSDGSVGIVGDTAFTYLSGAQLPPMDEVLMASTDAPALLSGSDMANSVAVVGQSPAVSTLPTSGEPAVIPHDASAAPAPMIGPAPADDVPVDAPAAVV